MDLSISLLTSTNYTITVDAIAVTYGADVAFAVGKLCAIYNYWHNKQLVENKQYIDNEGYFYMTEETFEQYTGMKRRKQTNVIDKLKALNWISTQLSGMPKKRYIKLNETEISKFLYNYYNAVPECRTEDTAECCTKRTLHMYETYNTVSTKRTSINNNINNKDIIKDNTIVLSGSNIPTPVTESSNNTQENVITATTSNANSFKLNTKPERKRKVTKKQQEFAKMFTLVDEVFNNEQVKQPKLCDIVKKYLHNRLGRSDCIALSYSSWEAQLQLLMEICEGDYEYAYDVTGDSLRGNYRCLCFSNQARSKRNNYKGGYNKPANSFDTSRKNDMDKGIAFFTEEEKEDFINNKLATDENGNLLKF